MCTRCTSATQRPVGRGRVMISRLFTRSRRSFRLPPAFHWSSSLSSHWLCPPRGSRRSFERGRERERLPLSLSFSLLALRSHLRSGVGKFAWPRGYVFVSNDLCRQMGRARVKVSCTALSMTGIDGERSSTCFSKECGFVPARYPIHAIPVPRPAHTTPTPHPIPSSPTLRNHSTRHRVENHPVIPRPRSAAPTTLTVNFVNYPRDPVPGARARPLFSRVPGIIDGLRWSRARFVLFTFSSN